MADHKKIVKYRKRRFTYVGVLFFISVFIYLLLILVFYFTRERVTIYEVVKDSVTIDENDTYTGFVLRDEIITKADESGYVNFYAGDSDRVSINSNIYSISGQENISTSVEEISSGGSALDAETLLTIRNNIEQFGTNFSNINFDSVYSFKFNMEYIVLESFNTSQLANAGEIFQINKAKNAGILTYYTDGYEQTIQENINNDIFNQNAYVRNILRPGDLVEKGDVLFKTIISEVWYIYTPLTDKEVTEYQEESKLKVSFLLDDITATADFEIIDLEDGKYGKFTFDKYAVRYANNRYLDFKIVKTKREGLKIPVSAVVEKEFYLVPEEFCFEGKDINGITTKNFILESKNEEGVVKTTTISPKLYYKDNKGFFYLSKNEVSGGDIIIKTDSLEEYIVSDTKKIKGIYNVNNGYAAFQYIKIKTKINDYYIIEDGNFYSAKEYDYIVLNGNKVQENEVVFR